MRDLSVHQFFDRNFVPVLEFADVELRRSLGDKRFGQFKGFTVDLSLFDVAEGVVFVLEH